MADGHSNKFVKLGVQMWQVNLKIVQDSLKCGLYEATHNIYYLKISAATFTTFMIIKGLVKRKELSKVQTAKDTRRFRRSEFWMFQAIINVLIYSTVVHTGGEVG